MNCQTSELSLRTCPLTLSFLYTRAPYGVSKSPKKVPSRKNQSEAPRLFCFFAASYVCLRSDESKKVLALRERWKGALFKANRSLFSLSLLPFSVAPTLLGMLVFTIDFLFFFFHVLNQEGSFSSFFLLPLYVTPIVSPRSWLVLRRQMGREEKSAMLSFRRKRRVGRKKEP